MKLPNGYGSIHKLPGTRRNPWRVRKTSGWDESTNPPRQMYITIGYFPTRQEALTALAEFNEHPYDIKTDNITFTEVYQQWSEEHFEKIVPSAQRTWKSAYSYCKPLYSMRFKDIRASHLERTIKNASVGESTKCRMKSLFNMMYRFALKHEIADKDYAALCDSVKRPKPKIVRIPFTSEEEQILWDNISFPFVDMVLIGLYSGWRPQELAILETENIDLEQGTMRGGLKTDSGKNRIVPIHPKILPLISALYNTKNKYLFNDKNAQQGTNLTYEKYYTRFTRICKQFGFEHKPHDTRHTFITNADRCGVKDHILKLVVGHVNNDVTQDVYTHGTLAVMKREIEKIENTITKEDIFI